MLDTIIIVYDKYVRNKNKFYNRATRIRTAEATLLLLLGRPLRGENNVLRIRQDSWTDDSREELLVTTMDLR
jgi:hypothetical protein